MREGRCQTCWHLSSWCICRRSPLPNQEGPCPTCDGFSSVVLGLEECGRWMPCLRYHWGPMVPHDILLCERCGHHWARERLPRRRERHRRAQWRAGRKVAMAGA